MPPYHPPNNVMGTYGALAMSSNYNRKLFQGIIGGEEVNNSGEDFTQSIVWFWWVVFILAF